MKQKYNIIDKGSSRYMIGEVKQFNQKNEIFKRMLWDPELLKLEKRFYKDPVFPKNQTGYRLEDLSMVNASWHLEDNYGMGILGGQKYLYGWDWSGKYSYPHVPSNLKIDLDNPQKITDGIKKAGTFFGATKIGVCELDRRWLYSIGYAKTPEGGKPLKIELPEKYKYAIVIVIEMDYNAIACSPESPSASATGLAYSQMTFVAGLLATYIRGLGYDAIPCGNDTACSIPLAIDAGLGELARNGLLITPEFGPRVRLAKVFTDLPLVTDKPIEFGVLDFCKTCKKCAENCPSQAIMPGDPTGIPHDMSNREGILAWQIKAKNCATCWADNGVDCANCIRTCPFNKPSGLLHNTVRWVIRNFKIFNRAWIWLDDLFGYGKKKNSDIFWSNIK